MNNYRVMLGVVAGYKPSFEETLTRHIMPIFMIFVLCVIIWTIYASIKNIIQRKKNKQYNAMFYVFMDNWD